MKICVNYSLDGVHFGESTRFSSGPYLISTFIIVYGVAAATDAADA